MNSISPHSPIPLAPFPVHSEQTPALKPIRIVMFYRGKSIRRPSIARTQVMSQATLNPSSPTTHWS